MEVGSAGVAIPLETAKRAVDPRSSSEDPEAEADRIVAREDHSSDRVCKPVGRNPVFDGAITRCWIHRGSVLCAMLLECSVDQVLQASRSLYAKLIPLVGNQDTKDQVIKPIGQVIKPIENISGADHTGSSQYASAGSEAESDMSMGI